MKKSYPETIKHFFTDLLGQETPIDITDTDHEISIQLELDPQDSGILIGYRGEALASIQLILSLVVQNITGAWKPVRLNINDYRQKRQQSLETTAQNAALKAVSEQQPIELIGLTSYERRIVHAYLNNDPTVVTESVGETPYRTLIISPASQ